MVYLRARFYNPAGGRFQSRDTWAGYLNSSQSQNRFSYVTNNPIRYVDPTGHYGWEDLKAEAIDLYNDPIGHTLREARKNQSMPFECTDVGQIALQAAPVIAPLVIVATLPMLLVSPDSAVDLSFMIYDHYTGNYAAFAADAMGMMLPGVTGLGAMSHADDAFRMVNRVDDIYDAGHAANMADDAYDLTRYADNCFNSFSAETEVATAEGDKAISLIQIGDYVLAWNEETSSLGWYRVTDTIHHTDEVVVHLTIDGEELETTPEHPFYVEGKGWVNAEDLQVSDEVRNAEGGTGEVEKITTEETSQEMYNLTVDEAHTFYVGEGQWLVHNTGGCNFVGEFPAIFQEYPTSQVENVVGGWANINDLIPIHAPDTYIPSEGMYHAEFLAEKISENGFDLAKSIPVIKVSDGTYVLRGGHHRTEALRLLGETQIPIIYDPNWIISPEAADILRWNP